MPSNSFMHQSIRMTLKPFIRLLLRYGVGYGEFAQVCKELYVDVAHSDFQIDNRKQTISRVSVLTGISRREIKSLREQISDGSSEYTPHNHAARILNAWLHDPDFQDKYGNAAPLAINAEDGCTFSLLARKYGNNTPFRAILDELLRMGAVEVDGGVVSLVSSSGYAPGNDSQHLLSVGLQSVADHISTIDYNDKHKPDTSHLQMTVNYDNVTDDGVEVFRQVSREKTKEVHHFLNRFLATQDRDNNPAIVGSGHNRTGIGIFYFEEKHEPESSV